MVREIHPSQSIRGQQMRDKLQAPCPHGVPGSKDRMRLSRLHRHNLFITRMKNNQGCLPTLYFCAARYSRRLSSHSTKLEGT